MGEVLTTHGRSIWQSAISLLLTASTLLLTLTFAPVSSAATSGVMSCCPDGSSTHCSSGMKGNTEPEPEPEPEPQPNCGHEVVDEVGVETIVAGPDNEDPPQELPSSANQASSPSLNAPCAIDCCSLVWSSVNRSSRDLRGVGTRKADSLPIIIHSKLRPSTVLRHASQAFNRATPRGPPSR
jgi:hypothetical protein